MQTKKINLLSLFSIFLALLFLAGIVYASTLSDYQAALNTAKAQYQSALNQAQTQYQTALNTANQNYQDALISSANPQNTEAAYETAISQAQATYEIAATSAYQDYQNQRKTAWLQYLGQTVTPVAPAGSNNPTTPSTTTSTTPTTPSASGSVPASVTVKTLIPKTLHVRYGEMCGLAVPQGDSIKAGETKYYKVDMTKWIDWQKVYASATISIDVTNNYNMCMSVGKGVLDRYNKECDPTTGAPNAAAGLDPATKLCATNECFSLAWLDTCETPPDTNYAQTCASQKDANIASINSALKAYQDLYDSGNYVTRFGSFFAGCSPYTAPWNNSWGCIVNDMIGAEVPLQLALGYNQSPVYESMTQFSSAFLKTMFNNQNAALQAADKARQDFQAAYQNDCYSPQCQATNQAAMKASQNANYQAQLDYSNSTKQYDEYSNPGNGPLSASNPVITISGTYVPGFGGDTNPMIFFTPVGNNFVDWSSVYGASEVYIMIHFPGVYDSQTMTYKTDGVPALDFVIAFGCPDAMSQQNYTDMINKTGKYAPAPPPTLPPGEH